MSNSHAVIGGRSQGTLLYATRDGGQTWTRTASVPFDVTNGEFLDMNHAWMVATSANDKTFYTTSDGWQHWTKRQMNIAFKRVYGFSFVSLSVGWALADNVVRFLPEPSGVYGKVISLLCSKPAMAGKLGKRLHTRKYKKKGS